MSDSEGDKLIDWEAGHVATGGNKKLLAELIEIFFEEYPKLLAGIRAGIDDRSAKDLRRYAHTLKGSLRYFGETHAGALSGELEVMGEHSSFEAAQPLLEKLEPEIDRLLPELQAFLQDR